MFNSDGKFCPNHIIKDHNGIEINEEKLYVDKIYDPKSGSQIEGESVMHFVDFEELGISFKIPTHNGNVVNRITDAIKSGDISCFDPKVIGLNILDAENQQTADVSAMNFLDIVDATRENQKREEMIPVVGE